MVGDEVVDSLMRIGPSDKESRTYVTILRNGATTIRVASKEADISKSYMYDIVGKFEERNLIEIDDHVQLTQLRVIPPTEDIGNLVSQLQTVESQLEDLFDSKSHEQQKFSIIKSRRTILAQLNKLIDTAESELVLALPASMLPRVEDLFREARSRGVLCMLLVTEYDDMSSIDDATASIIQTWSVPAPVMLTVDRSDGIIVSVDAILNSNSDEYAIYHTEEHIVSSLFDSFIANCWPMGEQVRIGSKSQPSATFASFHHAVFDATPHLMDGAVVTAEMDIRPTQSSAAFETTTGTIVAVKQSLVRPSLNDFSTQEPFVVETPDDTFTVSGSKALLEDLEARRVVFRPVSDAKQGQIPALSHRLARMDGSAWDFSTFLSVGLTRLPSMSLD